ncbi:DNA gyrase inhibitor YacG [Alphaproteobacteria bacterium LSUCC0719]
MTPSSDSLTCPTCGAPAAPPAQKGARSPRPFCSRRCADIDLGRWFQESYAIPAVESADDTIVESLAAAKPPREDDG